MSYPGTLNAIRAADSASTDAFSRWRTSTPQLRLSALFDTDKRPLYWGETTAGGGTAVHLPNEYSVALTVTNPGDEVIRQTKEYFSYRAAQSQLVFATFCMVTPEANLTQEVGINDANDGVIFQTLGTAVNIVLRTSTSGAPSDVNTVAQGAWNLDPLNGSGPSGLSLNLATTQILAIDYQWLGVGRVRVGFDIDGLLIYAHQFENANNLTSVYMKTPKLPVRYRIAATGAIGGARTMKQICSAVIREGGTDEPSVQREVDSGTAVINVGTNWETVVGIRVKNANLRATLRVLGASVLNQDTTDPIQFGVIINPGGTGAAVFADVPQSNSIAQFSRSNIAITVDGNGDPTSGVMLPLGDFVGAAQAGRGVAGSAQEAGENISLNANIAGTVRDEAWIVARVTTGTADVRGILKFVEIR